MANPSLQIGNENWAIKEDNLLGYSTAGTRFVPQPITMTRGSAGTRVNSEGLVETVELLGGELAVRTANTNQAFLFYEYPNNTITYDVGNTIITYVDDAGGGYAYFNSSYAIPTNLVIGITYKISITFKVNSGNVKFRLFNGVDASVYTEETSSTSFITQTVYMTAKSTTNCFIKTNSIGTGQVVTISDISVKESTKNNLARVDYDGSVSSLLVEPERENKITYSEDFSNAIWQKQTGIVPTYNTTETLSPDGTYNATKFIGTGSTGVFKSSVSVSGNITRSVYLKSVSGTTTAVFKDPNATGGATAVNLTITNDWQRFELIGDNGTAFQGLWIDDITSDGLYMWGAQLEEGSYPTSYIPTDGTTVTRVKDQYSKTGISDLINSAEGVLFVEMAALSDDGTGRYMSISDGGSTNHIRFYYSTNSNEIVARYYTAVGMQCNLTYTLSDSTDFNKIAFKWKVNDFALWVNGGEVDTEGSGAVNAADTFTELEFELNGGNYFYGKSKHLQIYKTALSDPELTALTT